MLFVVVILRGWIYCNRKSRLCTFSSRGADRRWGYLGFGFWSQLIVIGLQEMGRLSPLESATGFLIKFTGKWTVLQITLGDLQ